MHSPELKPNRAWRLLSFAARYGQHQGWEWMEYALLCGGYFNAESEGLHLACRGKGTAELSLGKAAYSEF